LSALVGAATIALGVIGCSDAPDENRPLTQARLSTFGPVRPYDPASPWNVPIGADAVVDPDSKTKVKAIADNGERLTSEVDRFTIAVYGFDASTPRHTVRLSGHFSSYDRGDDSRMGFGEAPTVTHVPIPDDATASAGSDGQIVIWNPKTGVEYSFFQFARDASGHFTATNGSRYRTSRGNHGRFADGLSGRGAGTPYLAGLVRPWEIAEGRVDHALAFSYSSPSSEFVYPASKSDGDGVVGIDVPEGTRLQLDPSLDLDTLGLRPTAKIIAKALQRYGMYVIDNGGSSKVYLEDRRTAGWDADVDRHMLEKIPLDRFRVVSAPNPPPGAP